jgi:hypothetical protein
MLLAIKCEDSPSVPRNKATRENAVDTKRLRRLIINCLRSLVGGQKADQKTKYLANKINQTLFLDNILLMRQSQVLPENRKADPGTTIQFC